MVLSKDNESFFSEFRNSFCLTSLIFYQQKLILMHIPPFSGKIIFGQLHKQVRLGTTNLLFPIFKQYYQYMRNFCEDLCSAKNSTSICCRVRSHSLVRAIQIVGAYDAYKIIDRINHFYASISMVVYFSLMIYGLEMYICIKLMKFTMRY